MKIEDAVALVTGASRGIGAALVEGLLSRGARHVYATSRNPRAPDQNRFSSSERLTVLQLDVCDERTIADIAGLASDVNLLINNAGVLTKGDIVDVQVSQFRQEIETNCIGLINVIQQFVPVIECNGGGVILNVLSVSALAGCPGLVAYSASKAAAWSITQSMRATLIDKKIQVLAAFPGPADTDMARDVDIPKASAKTIATGMLDGIEQREEEIFPDAMSRQAGYVWRRSPKTLERQLAAV
jgi:NAD(P)-dependent dehydrogenase (short-subunit alcohol dehydrogenase family)